MSLITDKNHAIQNDEQQIIESLEQCDWFSSEEVEAHQHIMEPDQRKYFGILCDKRDYFRQGFEHGNYFENAQLLLCANHHDARTITCCNYRVPGRLEFRPCRQWCFCSRCALHKSIDALARHSASFNKGTFYFVTASFKGGIPFDVTNNVRALNYWNAISSAFTKLMKDGEINGGYWVHELAALQFQPLLTLPHTHAVVHADRFTHDQAQIIADQVVQYAEHNGCDISLPPSIHFKKIENEREFKDKLQYCTKAIDIRMPYGKALDDCKDRAGVTLLNREVRNFLDDIAGVIHDYKRIHYIGSMMPQCKSYVGLKGQAFKDAREHVFTAPCVHEDVDELTLGEFLKE